MKLLMRVMGANTEEQLWSQAPEWANYVVENHLSIAFISGIEAGVSHTVKALRKDGVFWQDQSKTSKGHGWSKSDVVSARPQLEIEGEEVCQCLTGEILATMDVLNDVGHSQVVAEEFKFHLSLLLEMQRNRLMEK